MDISERLVMNNIDICICGNKSIKSDLCEECLYLLRAKKSKNIRIVEKFREDFNNKNGTYKSYGQFVLLLDMIDRRKRQVDDRRKKAAAKKIRRNR